MRRKLDNSDGNSLRQLAGKAACALALTGLALAFATTLRADPLTVKVEQGEVHGKLINDGKVRAFLGLPYAAPPVGNLRWKAPQPALKWKGIRDATVYGAHCPQNFVYDDVLFQDNGPSEDCLFLNVYTPAEASESSSLPVMFWIHGGGFGGGGSSEPRHNGDFLPLKGVVLVTINYRLGPFGFLVTEEMAKEGNGAAGNYGLLDMVAALRWVKANISKFGGNPGNVTIFGESAGSWAVCILMASPLAQGLFHKAIGESGGALSNGFFDYGPIADREKKDQQFVDSLGVKSLAELRALPTDKILESAKKSGIRFFPNLDGNLITEPIADIYAKGKQAHIPLLAGWNRDEGSFVALHGMTVAQWKQMANKVFGARADELLKIYPADTDAQAQRAAIDYVGDSFIALDTWVWLEAHRQTGEAAVYRYHFELPATPSKYHPVTFAFHSDDIDYVFGTLDNRPEWNVRLEDRKLSDQMMTYWTNFARTGDPNGVGLPEWPKYNNADYPLIHLNDPITAGPDREREHYEVLLKGMPRYQF